MNTHRVERQIFESFFFGSNPGEFHTCLWGVHDICLSNDQQSVYVVGTHCILPLCLGSVVHLTFIQCIFIFNTHCATDVPALLGCPPPSAVLFMGIFSSTTEITLSLSDSLCLFFICTLFFSYVFTNMYTFFSVPLAGEVQYSRYETRDTHVSGVQHPRTKWTPSVQACPRKTRC